MPSRLLVILALAACSSRPAPPPARPAAPPPAPDAGVDAPAVSCTGETCWRDGLRLAERDLDHALPMLEQACRDQVPDACRRTAAYRARSADKAALATLETMCKSGDLRACRSLAGLREDGAGGMATDLPGARAEYERLCTAGETGACNNLAIMLREGRGGAKDVGRAAALFRQVCEAGDRLRCFEIETVGEQPLACLEAGYEYACNWLAEMYAAGEASCGRDFGCQLGLHEMACMGGNRQACDQCGGVSECDRERQRP